MPATHQPDNTPAYSLRTADFSKALLNPDLETPSGIGKANAKQPAPKRFGVYRNNVVVSLMEALKAAYPSILAILGEENFRKVARFYVTDHPPKSAMMQTFGQEFPDFLRRFKPLSKSPFLIDLAIAERDWLSAYHALDADPLDPQSLSGFSPEESMYLVFRFHPAFRLIKSEFPLVELFGYRFSKPEDGIDMSVSQNMLITRPQYDVLVTEIDDMTAGFLEMLKEGQPLGNAIASSVETDENFDAAQAIATIMQTGSCISATLKAHN